MTEKVNLDKVLKDVLDMKKELENNTIGIDINHLKQKYSYVNEMAPTVFEVLLSNDPSFIPMFERMIQLSKKIQSKEEQEQQDKVVGELLAEKYIYPNIDMKKEKQSGI